MNFNAAPGSGNIGRAPNTPVDDPALAQAFQSKSFQDFYKMFPNVDSIRQSALKAEQEGVSKDIIDARLKEHIDSERKSIEKRTKELADGTIGDGDRFDHGISSMTSYIKTSIETDQARLIKLEALAKERGIE